MNIIKNTGFFFLLLIPLLFSCEEGESEWLVPRDEVFDGGPGKDGIPAIDEPAFLDVSDVNFLDDTDLIVGFKSGNEIKGYPHDILDWHEIVNDKTNNIAYSVVYCPLTGSATGWDRVINGKETTFGVSGLLYNTNIIPYDRETDSNWSQMELKCVNGKLSGSDPGNYLLIETSWKSWKELFPNSQVLSANTGFNRRYGQYPYGSYRTDNDLFFFPISNRDDRLPAKDRVYGIVVNDKSKAFPFTNFFSGLSVVEDEVGGLPVVVVGDAERNFVVGFERMTADGSLLNFSALNGEGTNVMTDNEGNTWDLFGYATSGPRAGERLPIVRGFIAYWFAWGTFFPDIEIRN
ncbi:MAG: DUF3179 domain-containing protein [Bacteroidia bacterium]|nr:DUF3179 domain-containing protein [Bacteroidia bacterium]